MKKNIISLLFLVSLLSSCGVGNEKEDVQSYLDSTSRMYQEQFEDTAAIAAHLTKGLAAHPDNIPLLQSRANLYCSRGMLNECRSDTQRLLELKPDFVEARMMMCMLDEFEKVNPQMREKCYLEVANLYAAQPRASSADAELSNKFNYVFALLMANSPIAEKEKAAFFSQTASDPRAQIFNELLDNFNKERALREIFGK